jgi:DNA-binding winged helix-turn-helix (wHTH) protein/tetratricopeptide (TPR) repeat protein
VLDADRRELTVADEVVTTQPKAFELLLYLVRNRSRAVDKDELQDALWPRSIVTETALTRCVMKARRAVGDDADRQAIIKTVHGHGYRFVATIEQQPAATPVADTVTPPLRDTQRRKPLLVFAAAITLVAAAAWWLFSAPAVSGEVRLAVLPVANETGNEELDWVRTGMMSLMNRMLEAKGVAVVGESSILGLAEDKSLEQLTRKDGTFAEALHRTTGFTHTLAAVIRFEQGLYRLNYTFEGGTMRAVRRTIVGKEPVRLVKDAVDTVSSLLRVGTPPDEHMRIISDDDFLNEAYARAMSLQFEGNYEDAKQLFAVIVEQDPELFWPRYEYALCVRNLRDFESAERLLVDIVSEQREAGNTLLEAISSNGLGILFLNQRRNDEAIETFERVIALATEAGKSEYIVAAHINLALVRRNLGDINAALEHLETAHEVLKSQDVDSFPGTFHNSYAGLLMRTGNLERAEQHSLAAIENFRLTGKRLYAAYAQSRLSTIYRASGRYAEARELAEASLAVRREFNDQVGAASSLLSLAELSVALGDLTRARQYAEQAKDIGVTSDDRELIAHATKQIAHVDREAGNTRAAVEGYMAAEAMYQSINDPIAVTNSRIGLARAWIDMREFGSAESIGREVLQAARDTDNSRLEARALLLIGEIDLARTSWNNAITSFDEALDIATRLGDASLTFPIRASLARAWLELGDTDAAGPLLEAATLERPEHTAVYRLQARMAWELGDAHKAAELMARARNSAGESWSDDDQAALERYREP